MHRFSALICFAVLLATYGSLAARAQTLYSYVDEDGVRILTNIPPKKPVQDLKLTGAAPNPTAAPTPAVGQRPTSYDTIIEKYADEYRLDPSLVRAMISRESAFNPKAVSPKGAQGLMQLMPATAARNGVRNVFDPEENIRGGMKHMRTLLDTFDNNLPLSLAAYNAGENLVQRIGRIPDFRETHDYVRTITRKYGKNHVYTPTDPAASRPSVFKFTDQKGILHLTNIPPVQRQE